MADDDTAPSSTEETATASAENNLATNLSSLSVAEASIDGSATVIPPPAAPVAAPQAQQLPINLPNFANLPDDHPALAIDHPDDFLSLLPQCILPRLERLKSLNEKRSDILEEYRIERAMLEVKFGKRMRPLYEERRGIVCGELDGAIDNDNNEEQKETDGEENEETKPDVSSMSIKSLKAELTSYGVSTESFLDRESLADAVNKARENGEQDNEQQQPAAGGENVKGIPQFWACAMGHVDVIAELITEADVDCLDHLTDITCTDFPDGLGFELTFHFSPNAFFTNTTLSKRYEVPNLLTEDEPILKNVTGTTINWKKDKSLTYKEVTKKQRRKGGPQAGQIRTITKKERTDSFFHFFTPPTMPGLSEVIDEEEADAVEEAFDHDYDVAQAFRGHLIPKAVLWFTGEAMMDGFDDEEGVLEEMAAAHHFTIGGQSNGAGGQVGQQFAFNPNAGGGNNPFPPPAAGDGANPQCEQS